MKLPRGAYPAMITPYTTEGAIDYAALKELTKWYDKMNCAGVLALCASSEMEKLTLDERVKMARVVVENKGNMTIVASGHISESIEDQIHELNEISKTGVDAMCMIVARINKLSPVKNDEDAFIKNLGKIIDGIENKDIPLAFYEWPNEFNMNLTEKILKFCASTGRFSFLKETACDRVMTAAKIKAVEGSDFGIYNANSTLLLESMKDGAAGFCGIMGNFHPDLYQWMCDNYDKHPEAAQRVQDYIGALSQAASQYPASARYHHQHYGAQMTMYSRRADGIVEMKDEHAERIHQMERVVSELRDWIKTLN